jgi:MtrB/PioB family decaheme-associated outer membrane protein
MSKHHERFAVRASVIAVHAALISLAVLPLMAWAADPAVAELTQPAKTVEAGAIYVDHSSFKFGEYNGLEQKGAHALLGLDVRGGAGYGSLTDATRYRVTGTDLGLRTRRLEAEYGVQGKYRVTFTHDELLRNYSDTYQTPYAGAGTTALTLPFYPPASTRLSANTTTANGALTNWANLQAPFAAVVGGVPTGAGPGVLIPANMRNFNVSTLRRKEGLDVGMELSPLWHLSVAATTEHKEGDKLTGVAFGGPARGALLPEPIDSDTTNLKAVANYVSSTSHLNLVYTGSLYKNNIGLWTVANPFQGNLLAPAFNDAAHLQGAPDNQMHRLSATGGYNFSKTTRLVVGAHHEVMTQDKAFITGFPANWSIPSTSAHAKVEQDTLTATLTSRPVGNVFTVASYKYDNRKNKTPVMDLLVSGGDAASAPNLFSTEPLNRRMQQLNLSADWSFARAQNLKATYGWEEIRRTANSEESPIRREKTHENTLGLEYRNNMAENLTGRVGYAYSQRRGSEYEENVLLAPVIPAPLPAADPLLPGFRQFWLADRNRDKLRSSLNFQASEAISVQTGLDYNRDRYINSPFGVKGTDSWVFKLDGTYAASDALSFSAFYTYEDKKSQLDSLAIARGSVTTILDAPANVNGTCAGYFAAAGHLPSDEGTDPCRRWSETQADRVHTLGVAFRSAEMMKGRFELSGDLAYSMARSPISVTGGAYFGNGNPATTAASGFNNIWIPAQSFPDITSQVIDLRLTGKYKLDPLSSVRMSWLHSRLRTNDWQYNAYTNSALGAVAIPTYIGTGITSPNYSVNVISVSYIHQFR